MKWSAALGFTGMSTTSFNDSPLFLMISSLGTLYASGMFTVPCFRIAQYSGTDWECIGTGLEFDGYIYSMFSFPTDPIIYLGMILKCENLFYFFKTHS